MHSTFACPGRRPALLALLVAVALPLFAAGQADAGIFWSGFGGGKLRAQRATTTGLDCAPTAIDDSQSTTCTATVTDTEAAPITPTGPVQLTPAGSSPCVLAQDRPGRASCSADVPANGPLTISASYAGDQDHAASASEPFAVEVADFALGKLRRNKQTGAAKLGADVPGPGTVTLRGKHVTTFTKTLHQSSEVVLKVAATGAAKDALAERGQVKLQLKVTYTPTGGVVDAAEKRAKLIKN